MAEPEDKTAPLEEAEKLGEGWDVAQKQVSRMSDLSALFSSRIRTIQKQRRDAKGDKSTNRLDGPARDAVKFLLQISPTLQRVCKEAALPLKGDALDPERPIETQVLLSLFSAGEFSSLLTLTYLGRRMAKRVDPEEWKRLAKTIAIQGEIGWLAGNIFPVIGSARGLLAGAIRGISQALFVAGDLKSWQSLRRRLASQRKAFDLRAEERLWGTNNLQLSALLLQAMGYGRETILPLGLSGMPGYRGEYKAEADDWHQIFVIIEELYTWGIYPNRSRSALDSIPEMAALKEAVKQIFQEGSHFGWLCGKAALDSSLDDEVGAQEK